MHRVKLFIISAAVFAMPLSAAAQVGGVVPPGGGALGIWLQSFLWFAQETLIPILLAIGFLFFVWGMFYYFIIGSDDDEKKKTGKSVLIYTTIGFVLIFIFWGALNLIASVFGLEGRILEQRLLPKVPVPPR
jgi:hypothetical protein